MLAAISTRSSSHRGEGQDEGLYRFGTWTSCAYMLCSVLSLCLDASFAHTTSWTDDELLSMLNLERARYRHRHSDRRRRRVSRHVHAPLIANARFVPSNSIARAGPDSGYDGARIDTPQDTSVRATTASASDMLHRTRVGHRASVREPKNRRKKDGRPHTAHQRSAITHRRLKEHLSTRRTLQHADARTAGGARRRSRYASRTWRFESLTPYISHAPQHARTRVGTPQRRGLNKAWDRSPINFSPGPCEVSKQKPVPGGLARDLCTGCTAVYLHSRCVDGVVLLGHRSSVISAVCE